MIFKIWSSYFTHMCLTFIPRMCLQSAGIRTEVTGGCETRCVLEDPNPGPLQEPVLWTTEPSPSLFQNAILPSVQPSGNLLTARQRSTYPCLFFSWFDKNNYFYYVQFCSFLIRLLRYNSYSMCFGHFKMFFRSWPSGLCCSSVSLLACGLCFDFYVWPGSIEKKDYSPNILSVRMPLGFKARNRFLVQEPCQSRVWGLVKRPGYLWELRGCCRITTFHLLGVSDTKCRW